MFDTLRSYKVLLPLLLVVNLTIIYLADKIGTFIPVLILGIILLILLIYISYNLPQYNIILLLIPSYLIPWIIKAFRLYLLPISNVIEGSCLLILFILILNKRISGLKSLPGTIILIWIGYQFFELVNPNTTSRVASLIALRSWIPMLCSYFIIYSSTRTKNDVYTFIIGWFTLSLFAALYGLYQEFIHFPEFDYRWATYDEQQYNLFYTWGRFRKFSFFFSPTDFALVLVLTSIAGLVLFIYTKKTSIKIFASITSGTSALAMMYTGTRTATVLLAVGLVIFTAISLNRYAIIIFVLGAIGFVGLMIRPTSNRALFVMMTAFQGSEDPSMQVRLKNQQLVRTFIQSKPIGFGLGSTGYLGNKYSPHTFVGSFPPDSEYVKIAIETGWIGLFIWCMFQAIIFGYSIKVYFKARDPEWKGILVVLISCFFMFIVCQYPQEIFRSQVLSILYCSYIGLIAKIDNIINENSKPNFSPQES